MHVRETLMRLITIATFDLFRTCMFGLRILSMVFFYKLFFPNFPIPSHISPKFIKYILLANFTNNHINTPCVKSEFFGYIFGMDESENKSENKLTNRKCSYFINHAKKLTYL